MNPLRVTILFCLFHLFSMMQAEQLHENGLWLCRLGNLPHRGLGMLFTAHKMYPDRHDFVLSYLTQWVIADHNELFLEGQTQPVVPMYAVVQCRNFPRSGELLIIRNYLMDEAEKKNKAKSK